MKTPAAPPHNPYRPGAGHAPPYLAGRDPEISEFDALLDQAPILRNLVLTGLRGVGKTVLLERLRPLALRKGWGWVGPTNLSESTSISEENLATRLLADLAVLTAGLVISRVEAKQIGFLRSSRSRSITLDFDALKSIHDSTPGLSADKLAAVFAVVHKLLPQLGLRSLVFAYDEAQNLADHASDGQYPLSLLLDVFQSLQAKGIPFLLVLAGLPTLFPKLVEARTYSERMFRVLFLHRLDNKASREAILKPLEGGKSGSVKFDAAAVALIIRESGGYPYFIQFICRECFDAFLQKRRMERRPAVPVQEIMRKLDSDFFAGRWARVTDRQRELLAVIAGLDNCDTEFTAKEIVATSRRKLGKPFSGSHVNQMLVTLADAGLVYKNRHGRYSFAVPLLGKFIRRQP